MPPLTGLGMLWSAVATEMPRLRRFTNGGQLDRVTKTQGNRMANATSPRIPSSVKIEILARRCHTADNA